MKKIMKHILGVTLLEVLLVLVIASLILVMSIKYYATATSGSKIEQGMGMLTSIISAVDSYLNSGSAVSTVSCASAGSCNIAAYLPGGTIAQSPWGSGAVTVSGGATTYTVTFPAMPVTDCTKFVALATQNASSTQITAGACAASGVAFTVVP